MPKAVYRSGCRDKHDRPQRDSNLGRQSDALTIRPLRPPLICPRDSEYPAAGGVAMVVVPGAMRAGGRASDRLKFLVKILSFASSLTETFQLVADHCLYLLTK